MTDIIRLRAAPMLWGLARTPFGISLLACSLAVLLALLGSALGLAEGLVAGIAIAAVLALALALGREPLGGDDDGSLGQGLAVGDGDEGVGDTRPGLNEGHRRAP